MREKDYEKSTLWINLLIENTKKKNDKYLAYSFYIKSFNLSNNKNLSKEEKDKELRSLLKHIDEYLKKESNYKVVAKLAYIHILNVLNKFEEVFKYYYKLEMNLQQDIDFVQEVVQCLCNNNRKGDCIKIFNNIDDRFKNTQDYSDLCNLLFGDSEIKEYNTWFSKMLSLSGDIRFKVLPPKINKHNNDIGLFICNEICYAFKDLLDKIISVNKAKELMEDNITDLLQIILERRLRVLDYSIKDQSRGGVSASGVGAGERDLVICGD